MAIEKEEVLKFHSEGINGKIEISLPKAIKNAHDLSVAYSPGVAIPCLEIQKNEDLAYDYTSKSHMVAVISNGTAVLGLGDIGAIAGKPVMEGKCALMKTFANVDAVDVEVETKNVDEFVNVVKNIGKTWGGINLEDVKAPECFEIERQLQELLDIPVFHDDQHGSAIVMMSGLLNACEVQGKDIKKCKITMNGAGAATLASANLIVKYGVPIENITICDSKGVIYKGRDGVNKYKEPFAHETDKRTLAEAVAGADIFLGMSKGGVLTAEMVKSMAEKPILFAMANPEPEVRPEVVHGARDDAIIGTGRSDYPNQINNVLCFPYLFRAVLDCRATKITDNMKISAVEALAKLARDTNIPEELRKTYPDKDFNFGKNYIIVSPFDRRLLYTIPLAVVEQAMKDGVAKKPLDLEKYKEYLKSIKG